MSKETVWAEARAEAVDEIEQMVSEAGATEGLDFFSIALEIGCSNLLAKDVERICIQRNPILAARSESVCWTVEED